MGKKSTKTTSRNVYGKTTTTNPYATATTNNSGTTSAFKQGSAFDTIYNLVNNNIGSMLDDYLNPNINSATNQSKINAYQNALQNTTYSNLENGIINPLSKRNMLRSSQAADLYKNLSNKNASSLDSYIADIISSAQDDSAKMINTLLQLYMNGYNVISDTQDQSLRTSSGNATKTNSTSNGSSQYGDLQQILAAVAKIASSL